MDFAIFRRGHGNKNNFPVTEFTSSDHNHDKSFLGERERDSAGSLNSAKLQHWHFKTDLCKLQFLRRAGSACLE